MENRPYPNMSMTVRVHPRADLEGFFGTALDAESTRTLMKNLCLSPVSGTRDWAYTLGGTTCRDSMCNSIDGMFNRIPAYLLYKTFGYDVDLTVSISVPFRMWYPHVAAKMIYGAVCSGDSNRTVIVFKDMCRNCIDCPPKLPSLHYLLLYLTLNSDSFVKTTEPNMDLLYTRFNKFILENPLIFNRESNKKGIALFTAYWGYVMGCSEYRDTRGEIGSAKAGEVHAIRYPVDFLEFIKAYALNMSDYSFTYAVEDGSGATQGASFDTPVGVSDYFGSLVNKKRTKDW